MNVFVSYIHEFEFWGCLMSASLSKDIQSHTRQLYSHTQLFISITIGYYYTTILEANLFAFAYRLFHEDFSLR